MRGRATLRKWRMSAYAAFVALSICISLPAVLPSLKPHLPEQVYHILSVVGIIAQFIP